MSHLTVNRCIHRSHLVEELVEDWQFHHQEAMSVREIEELAQECIWLSKLVEDAWRHLRGSLFDNQFRSRFDELDRIYKIYRPAVTRTVGTFSGVKELIGLIKRKGFDVENSSEFFTAHDKTGQIENAITREWPITNHSMRKASLRDYQEGRVETIEDLLDAAAKGESS